MQMFLGCHGVGFVSVMSAFSGSIPFSPNVTMIVYHYPLSLESSKLPFGGEAFVSSRSVVLFSLCVVKMCWFCDESIRCCICELHCCRRIR